jgi:hypothetical protein
MTRKLTLLLILLNLSFAVCVAAPKPVHDTVYINTGKPDELAAYKLLAENAQKSYTDQRETTEWFLGIVSTFLISIIVSQVIFNTGFINKKIENVQADFNKTIAEQSLELSQQLESGIDDARAEINLAIENQLTRVYSTIESATDNYNLQLESFRKEQKIVTLTTSSAIKLNEGKSLYNEANYGPAISKFISAGEDLISAEDDVYNALECIDACVHKMEDISIKKLKSLKAFIELASEHSQEDATNMDTIEEIKKGLELKKVYKMAKGVKVYI